MGRFGISEGSVGVAPLVLRVALTGVPPASGGRAGLGAFFTCLVPWLDGWGRVSWHCGQDVHLGVSAWRSRSEQEEDVIRVEA